VVELVEDPTELPLMYMPGHPEADANGMVRMPNVNLPLEMVNLLTASRAYEANLRASQTFRTLNEQALILIRG
jgi:flagellar basal-body rod protein FlgC